MKSPESSASLGDDDQAPGGGFGDGSGQRLSVHAELDEIGIGHDEAAVLGTAVRHVLEHHAEDHEHRGT